ncbi:XRE family transcriptional regulator [Flavobacteriaceae bacterium JJC]|uniref:helix-turn-helix domain-containing protein n=1 Tax=Kaistella soli TaxID=2849654 RepID=UPI000B4B7783|nr:helix-turn-helix domain-containing protein [Kaistella soli]MBU8884061.1 helix-turn-helix domain-containing protein [Kaistella soli]OWK72867.1 XRE family transcriptional regulator [Flavobacteriaceae bacterium JJC]
MKSIVQRLREEKNLTQTELAEKSGLSLRTIQRIEAGNVPKGFTLKTLANTFETEPENLLPKKENLNLDRAKLINFSSLLGLIIPFGGVIFPLILTYKTEDPKNRAFGKSIVSVQIIISAVLVLSQIASPFVQKGLSLHFPLFLVPLIFIICVKLMVVIFNGISLNNKNDLHKSLKINFL